MSSELQQSISKMIVNGNRLELPSDEVFSNYAQVKKTLIQAGGKYKKCGFEFASNDPRDIKDKLCSGEKINDKKKFQFFATPKSLAAELVRLAEIEPHHRCLEPSAGHGAIADLVQEKTGFCTVVELMPENAAVLKSKGYEVAEGDFLKMVFPERFDRIIANPPFAKNQDIDHIRRMYSMLSDRGMLVSIASLSWLSGSQRKQVEFRAWLAEIGATTTNIPAGEFKQSGTSVGAVIVQACRAL